MDRIGRGPEELATTENHPSWTHMYQMMMLAQIGFALAYVFSALARSANAGPDRHHQHRQCRRRQGRDRGMELPNLWFKGSGGFFVWSADRRRNLGRQLERHQRLSRQTRACLGSDQGGRERAHRGGHLVIAGVPVGKEITDLDLIDGPQQDGSIIIVVGTDAPLSPSQLNLVAKRAALGMGRTGTIGESASGDIFLAFSTSKVEYDRATEIVTAGSLSKSRLTPVFRATVEATEEAIVNALVAGKDMEGLNGSRAFGIPHDRLREAMRKYNRGR
jgi:hypothetical protein